MDFRILGPLAVGDDVGVDVPIAGTKLRTLLALLLVRPGEAIAAERLADDLWGEAGPAGAANALQSLVSKLRRSLADAGRLLVTTPQGYRLDVPPDEIDAVRFVDAVQEGRRELAAGRPSEASGVLRRALAMWCGTALEGLRDDGVLQREAVRLEELRLSALEDCLDADLRLGRHAELVAELGSLTTTHPLREGLHGLLMLALYRAGRQSEALRAFQHARQLLAEELGLDPGPDLRALETAILDHDPSLDLDVPAHRGSARHRTNITKGLSTFIGRMDDVAALRAVAATNRLVTVVGPGGAGKTRLTVEAAAASVGDTDVWFVDLAPLQPDDADAVPGAVAVVVGLADGPLTSNPQSPGRSTVARIVEQLGDRNALLILDNCEHVTGEAARIAESMLIGCPGLTIIATSREALNVRGETVWPVPPMSVADAVALFTDRASATSGFTMSGDDIRTVTDVCERLDGMPLAIELAAGRVRAIPVHQLAARLDDRFRLLTGGARTALPRQQTLRAVVEWSYDLLFDDEQRVFDRLSVFSGGCSLEAAESVCGGDDIAVEDVADLLGHLVDKSLVGADHSGPQVRYRLLQTLALYGRERLAATADVLRVRARHAEYFAELCRRGHAAFRGVDQESWLAAVDREADNLRSCLAWLMERGEALQAQTMLGGLAWSWWFAGKGDEGWRLLTACLECRGESSPLARASAAMWACYVGACAGAGTAAAAAVGEEAVALLRSHPGLGLGALTTENVLPDALMLLAHTYAMAGRGHDAVPLFQEAHHLLVAIDDDYCRAMAKNTAGHVAELSGDIQLAYDLQCESVEFFEAAHVEWALAIINGDCGLLATRLGRYDDGVERMHRARRAAQHLRLGGYEALLLGRLGAFALASGDVDLAESLTTQAIEMAQDARYSSPEAFGHMGMAVVRQVQYRFDDAIESAVRADAIFHRIGLDAPRSQTLSTIGLIAQHRGDIDTAQAMHHQGAAIARSTHHLGGIALGLEGLAGVALLRHDPQRAAALLGAAEARRAADGGGAPGPESHARATRLATIDLLGQDAFAAAAAAGAQAQLDDLLNDDHYR